jgi:hypothetical protein
MPNKANNNKKKVKEKEKGKRRGRGVVARLVVTGRS